MIDENKISIALSKMNRETKENKLKWEEVILTRNLKLSSSEELVGKIYQTTFIDRILWLFKINEQSCADEFEYSWIPSFKLIVLDSSEEIDWEFPFHRGIIDLYVTVSYKVANMDSFFSSIKEDDISDFLLNDCP